MKLMNQTVEEAVDATIAGFDPDDGGIIAVGVDGSTVMRFNTESMHRGILTSEMDNEPVVGV